MACKHYPALEQLLKNHSHGHYLLAITYSGHYYALKFDAGIMNHIPWN